MAKRLRDDIFSIGNTVDPAEAYKKFRGREPGIAALMRKRGFPVPADAKARIQARRDELAMNAQKLKVETELEALRGALASLENEAAIAAASEAVDKVRQALESGAELEKKLPRYGLWATQTLKGLSAAKASFRPPQARRSSQSLPRAGAPSAEANVLS